MKPRDRHLAFECAAACLLAALLTCGCQFDGKDFLGSSGDSGILAKHFSNDRRAGAQQHWDEVRGGIQLQLAENQFRSGRLDDAEKTLEQALALAPDNPKTHLLVARLHLERGDLAKARNAVEQALALSVREAEAEYVAGIIAQRYGDLPAALDHYTAATALSPQTAHYVIAEAETLAALDRPIDAMELIESRIGDFDGNAPLRMLAAHLNQTLGLRAPAADYAREAIRIQDDDASLVVEAGRILVWAGQYDEAVTVLRPLVDKASSTHASTKETTELAGPLAPSVLRDLAAAYMARRQWREAQWAVKLVMARDDTDVAAWCLYVQSALMMNDLDAAGEAVRSLQTNTPATPETLLLAGYVALRRGAPEEAFNAATQAIRMNDGLFAAHCLLGRACEALGRMEQAENAYAKAASLEPNSPLADTLLNRLRSGAGVGPGSAEPTRAPPSPANRVAADINEDPGSAEGP
jgi:tetratricopeptide (TPR) repeat protein